MRIGALILGILGGLIALGYGQIGYGLGSLAGLLGQGEVEGFLKVLSVGLPVVALAGAGIVMARPAIGAILMAIAAVGFILSLGFNFFTLIPVVLLGLGAMLGYLDSMQVAGQIAAPLSKGQVAGQIAAPLSRLVQSVRRQKPDIALTGFDAQGQPVMLKLSPAELDAQQGGFTVGRHPLLVDQVLNGERLSKRHARFSGNNGSVFVEDLNSSNGTSVNGRACLPFQSMQIQPGDTVDVGDITLRVSS